MERNDVVVCAISIGKSRARDVGLNPIAMVHCVSLSFIEWYSYKMNDNRTKCKKEEGMRYLQARAKEGEKGKKLAQLHMER